MTVPPSTPAQRLVLTVAVLASFIAFLDGTVINVALPAITRELGGGISTQQWVVDAYLVTLGSVILLAGSLSDAFGRGRVLFWGLVGFLLTSLLCALSPSAAFLIGARGLQGFAAALLVPSSLAVILSTFSGAAQARAIGAWTAWTSTAFIAGPVIGGLLVDLASWRGVFAINALPIAVTLMLLARLPADRPADAGARVDVLGAVLGVVGLGLPVFALIEQPNFGWASPVIFLPAALGAVSFALFILHERRIPQPMMPLRLFQVRNFSVGNVATTFFYGALSIGSFVLAVFLQQVGGYTATFAGLALLPVTIFSILLSTLFGKLAGVHGPRLFMCVGPLVGAAGFLLMLRITDEVIYWTEVLPGVLVFGLGLSITVAPLTSAILGAIDPSRAGIASAVNNAVSRVAGLVAIAALSVVVGSTLDLAGLHRAVIATGALMVLAGVVSGIGIVNGAKPVAVDVAGTASP